MVKVIRVHRFGGPEVLQLEDIDVAAPGPREVRVAQRAIGLNYIDVYQRTGLYPNPLPLIPGNEAAGEVVAVGSDVTGFKPGDRVAYVTTLGGYAAERLIEARHLLPLPSDISTEAGAVMMLKGLTAQYLLRQTYKVAAGDTILVQAAAGGVGLLLCQWAKALGATVIGTVGSEEKAALARANGAHHTILYRDEDFAARVKEITEGKLCNVVYDGVGQATFPRALDCLRAFGTFVSFGAASGPIAAFDMGLLGRKGSLFATRPTLFTFVAERDRLLAMTEDMLAAIRSGALRPDVTHRFALQDAADAHRALEARETSGSTILVP